MLQIFFSSSHNTKMFGSEDFFPALFTNVERTENGILFILSTELFGSAIVHIHA